MNCREFTEFLMAYLDRELPEVQHVVFEQHMQKCPPCREYLDTYRQAIELEKKVCCCDDDPPPEDVPDELIQAILRARRTEGAE